MLTALKYGNLALAFILELCALGALGYWGFRAGGSLPTKIALAIGAPLLLAVFWGLFLAPRANFPVPDPWSMALKVAVFAAAALALAVAGQSTLAWALAVVVAINLTLGVIWAQ